MNTYSKRYIMLKKKNLEQILRKEKKVNQVSQEMGVSRQTVSKWLCRNKRFGEESLYPKQSRSGSGGHNRTSEEVEDMVIELAKKYWDDGVETLSDRLFAEHKIFRHSTTIYRILKRRGERYDHRWNGTKKRQKKQLYAHKTAGKELQIDTKYPFAYKAGVVVYTAIDDASRWSFCSVYETANALNTVDFLRRLEKACPFDIQKIRTDCGTEFVARKVLGHLEERGIDHRRNTPYCPEENGKIERFHRTLNEKSISLYWSSQDSIEVLRFKLSQFLDWYNFQKRHRGLGMDGLTPFQKLVSLASENVNLTLQCNKS